MSPKLICAILVALFAVQIQNASANERRDLSLPSFNFLDILNPVTSINNFINFVTSLFSGLTQAGQSAINTGEDSKNSLETLASSIVNSTKNQVESLVGGAIAKIEDAVNKTPLGNAIRAATCGGSAIATITGAGVSTVKDVIGCTTNQIGLMVTPALDLVNQGRKGLTFGLDAYKNLSTSCFPDGLTSINALNFIPILLCGAGQISPIASSVTNIVSSIGTDIQNFQASVDNIRNSIVRCPRETVADLVINLGNVVTTFGLCASGTSAPANARR